MCMVTRLVLLRCTYLIKIQKAKGNRMENSLSTQLNHQESTEKLIAQKSPINLWQLKSKKISRTRDPDPILTKDMISWLTTK